MISFKDNIKKHYFLKNINLPLGIDDICLALYISLFLMQFTILALERDLREKINKSGSFMQGIKVRVY